MRQLFLAAAALAAAPLAAQSVLAPLDPMTNDKVASYDWVRPQADFVRREVMMPMRDGTKLFTVIVYRKGTKDAPILLSRTPYDAGGATSRNRSQKIEEILPIMDAPFVNDGYIRVYQDVRGLHKSEGDYVMARPLSGPLNKTGIDHSTDAFDTIDWLIKNLPEGNGKVGIIGSSYLGYTALMALIDPHPALKAAVPQSPMVDGWIGDDWFHNGAFRTFGFDYSLGQTVKEGGGSAPTGLGDEYISYLAAGSSAGFARAWGIDQLPAVRKMIEHPAYDQFWQEQAVDRLLAKRKLTVPTLVMLGQWDQEDSYGGPAVFKAIKAAQPDAPIMLGIGPWRHSGTNYEGFNLGALKFEGDTALQFRMQWIKPFLDCRLKSKAAACAPMPAAVTYATGTNQWEVDAKWPAGTEKPLYLAGNFALSFEKPVAAGSDAYVSDPAKPVPFVPRPIRMEGDAWRNWLVQDQRFADGRSDVLSYSTAVLGEAVHIKGAPRIDLRAATSGQDSDFVVKLIDVYPSEASAPSGLPGYQLGVGIEIFRGRYVHGFSSPAPLVPGKTYAFGWSLPNVNHVFLPGHRIMVQVQSSLFPLYDRNPQTWVPSIMDAPSGAYRKATQTVRWGGAEASAVWLPVARD
ncbi:MAG: CocE/NonD family hydrolase [Novosphingobium sp.]|uniref:CocE/NonD family hydrolase n=1 Tax=Novosphingobium sp. TaxID=1874826 RepID=UPI0032B8913A